MRNCLRVLGGEVEVAAVEEGLLEEVVADHAVEAVRRQTHTDEVVEHHERLRVEALSVLHEAHQKQDDQEVDQVANDDRLGVHEGERLVVGFYEMKGRAKGYGEGCFQSVWES